MKIPPWKLEMPIVPTAIYMPVNMILTSANVMAAMCTIWLNMHPEDADLSLRPLFWKIMRDFALQRTVTMVMYTREEDVRGYGILSWDQPNG